MPRVLLWNGRDLPEELRGLPPGTYLLERLDDPEEAAPAPKAAAIPAPPPPQPVVETPAHTSETVSHGSMAGNALFEIAVEAIELDGKAMRWLLVSILKAIGSAPSALTPDELGAALPEFERRLRLLVQPDQADRAMARLANALMSWSE
jgi:hypothetical protein